MPIRINLKELFSADSRENLVDKINFNFNKLLALGVGEEGEIGLTGGEGPIGPFGNTGSQGVRGSSWFVGAAADPNLLTFTDLLANDFYLNSQTFTVWQYNGTTWDFLFDLSAIINQYLAASPSPFVRGLGIGSPNDDRFILFNRRGNTTLDDATDIDLSTAADNDILFLSNFNEDLLSDLLQSDGFNFGPALTAVGDQVPTVDLFTSLLSVYVNHSASTGLYSRYHIELGSLYSDLNESQPEDKKKLTTSLENMKIKFLREETANPLGDHYNIAQFSLDKPDSFSFGSIDRVSNGIFEFRTPKWSGSGMGSRSQVFIGSRYGFVQLEDTANDYFKVDGILFKDEAVTGVLANVGLAVQYSINAGEFPDETGYVTNIDGGLAQSYLTLEALGDTVGILLDSKTLQDGGNFIQLGTTEPRSVSAESAYGVAPSSYLEHQGIAAIGSTIYSVIGNSNVSGTMDSKYGYFQKFTVDNPNNPKAEFPIISYVKFNGRTDESPVPIGSCGIPAYNGTNQPIGPGACDIDVADGFAYVVNSQGIAVTSSISEYRRTYFQVLSLNSMNSIGLTRVGRLGEANGGGSDPTSLDSAYRVKVRGRYAIVARNAIYSSTFPALGSGSYQGGIAAVDISDPTSPTAVANNNFTKRNSTGTVLYDNTAALDMTLARDMAYALVFSQKDNTTTINYEVNVQAYDLSTLENPSPTLAFMGLGSGNLTSGVSINAAAYNSVPKRGAIAANDHFVYAGYGTMLKVYKLNVNKTNVTNLGCVSVFSSSSGVSLPLSGSTVNEIIDLKLLGNSLYVLAHEDHSTYYLLKYDVSGGFQTGPTNPVLIYQKEIGYPAGRMIVIGKHVYVALRSENLNDAREPSLLAVDFDGFYTGGAHIESLRADEFRSTGDASIGRRANIGADLNVGGFTKLNADVSISQDLHVVGDQEINGNLDVDGDVSIRGTLTVVSETELQSDLDVLGDTTVANFEALGPDVKIIKTEMETGSPNLTSGTYPAGPDDFYVQSLSTPSTLTTTPTDLGGFSTDSIVYIWIDEINSVGLTIQLETGVSTGVFSTVGFVSGNSNFVSLLIPAGVKFRIYSTYNLSGGTAYSLTTTVYKLGRS